MVDNSESATRRAIIYPAHGSILNAVHGDYYSDITAPLLVWIQSSDIVNYATLVSTKDAACSALEEYADD